MIRQSNKDFPPKKQPEFSVVIPLYNKESTIQRAIESVMSQTIQDFEIIVVNDGSTDNGPGVVSSFKDPRIRLINQKNQGVSVARNRGILEAGHELIAFLDADDEWLPGFLETILELSRNYPQCGVYGTRYLFGMPDGRTRPCLIRGLEDGFFGVLGDYFAVAARSDPPIHSSAVVVRKNAIKAVGGFPPGIRSGEDLLTWARLAINYSIAYCIVPFVLFYQGDWHCYEKNVQRLPDTGNFVGEELKKLLDECIPGHEKKIIKYIALWHKMRLSLFARSGMFFDSFFEWAFCVRFDPFQLKSYVLLIVSLLPTKLRYIIYKYLGTSSCKRL